MKCPHCYDSIYDYREYTYFGKPKKGYWFTHHMTCPSCGKEIIHLVHSSVLGKGYKPSGTKFQDFLAWPRQGSRPPAPQEVPSRLAQDFNEACLVVDLSPKSSAALSRRCLQSLLRDKARVSRGKLSAEIQQAIDSDTLPSHITESLNALREIGNFAAHPTKDQKTGEIIEVETGEAEWTLDILEALFDFYFVAPAKTAKRKAVLNEKLQAANRKEVQ